jgi:hypothetical protein
MNVDLNPIEHNIMFYDPTTNKEILVSKLTHDYLILLIGKHYDSR